MINRMTNWRTLSTNIINIQNVDKNKSQGSDGVAAKCLKASWNFTVSYLAQRFNQFVIDTPVAGVWVLYVLSSNLV